MLSYSINISLYCFVAIPIVPLKELHYIEWAIIRRLLYRNLHLHMSPVLEAHKLVRSCHGQCIRKTANYFFPQWTVVCLPAVYPTQFVVPGVKDIYASMDKVDTIDSPMVLV
jgi:hypothetical protein